MANYRDDKVIQDFGARVREVRKGKNWTIEQLAAKAGFEYSQIARIERGKVNTTISTAKRIADALDVWVGELFNKS